MSHDKETHKCIEQNEIEYLHYCSKGVNDAFSWRLQPFHETMIVDITNWNGVPSTFHNFLLCHMYIAHTPFYD